MKTEWDWKTTGSAPPWGPAWRPPLSPNPSAFALGPRVDANLPPMLNLEKSQCGGRTVAMKPSEQARRLTQLEDTSGGGFSATDPVTNDRIEALRNVR